MPFDPSTAKPEQPAFDPGSAQPAPQNSDFARLITGQAPPKPAGGDLGGSLYAGIHGFEDMATFGQGDKLAAITSTLTEQVGGMLGLDKAGITKAPQSYDQNLQDIQKTSQAEAQAHPIANAAGEVAGILPGGELGARALGAVGRVVPGAGRVARALAPVANQPVTNVLKSAATNATVGGAVGLANGQDLPQAAQTAGVSALVGPVVGKAAAFTLEKLAPAAQRAYMVLADKLGMKSGELQTAIQNYQQVSGGAIPTVAGLANLKAQGRLQELAKANSTIADRAAQAANPGLMTPAQQGILKIAQGGGPQTESDLFDLRKRNMDTSMGQIRDTPIPYSQRTANQLGDPIVQHALRQNAQVLGDSSIMSKVENYIADGPSGSHLTLDDLDQIRESLRNRQDTFSDPQSAGHDRHVAREFGQAANKVEMIGTAAEPRYGAALQQYRNDSDYLNGFSHGIRGNAVADAQPGSQTAIGLTRPSGQAGYAHGNQLFQSQSATEKIAPSTVRPQSQFGAHNASQLAAGIATAPSPWSIAHFIRALPGVHLPEPVQAKIGQMLFDPRQTQAAVNVLQKAGVKADAIRHMGALAGAQTSARVAAYLSQKGQ